MYNKFKVTNIEMVIFIAIGVNVCIPGGTTTPQVLLLGVFAYIVKSRDSSLTEIGLFE